MKQLAFLITLAVLITFCTVKQNPWANDLDFIYKSILENHPGVYNNEDPNFCENLEKSYETAKLAINASTPNARSKITISDFAKSFNDTHLWVYWHDNTPQKQHAIISKFSISRPANGVAWITLPTFYLNSEQEKNFGELLKQLLDLKKEQYIVFDLRGN